jgi:hypothetical protein
VLLATIATTNDHWPARKAAVQKLSDRNLLARIAQEDEDPDVRTAAGQRLQAL